MQTLIGTGRTIESILDEMAAKPNMRVMMVAPTQIRARWMFELAALEGAKHDATMRRTNGSERVSLPNGARLIIASSRGTGMRGHSVDLVVVDDFSIDTSVEMALLPLLSVSGGPIVHISPRCPTS